MRNRNYFRELGLALGIYIVLLIVSVLTMKSIDKNQSVRVVIAMLPVVGGVLVARAVLRRFQTLDELERRIQLDALAWAFLGSALTTFSWGFAETAGAPKFPTFGFWPLMAIFWILGSVVSHRRYR
jgi:hypothetical protein